MGRRGALITAAMVIVAIGTTLLYLYLYANQADDYVTETQPREVLVASDLIPAGMTAKEALKFNLIETMSFPHSAVAEGAVGKISLLAGQEAIVDIFPGQQILIPLFEETTTPPSTVLREVDDGLSIEQLDVIEARVLAATPGEWRWVGGRDHLFRESFIARGGVAGHPYLYLATEPDERVPPQDFDFIASAHQDVQSLVAEVRRLRSLVVDTELRRLREVAAD